MKCKNRRLVSALIASRFAIFCICLKNKELLAAGYTDIPPPSAPQNFRIERASQPPDSPPFAEVQGEPAPQNVPLGFAKHRSRGTLWPILAPALIIDARSEAAAKRAG